MAAQKPRLRNLGFPGAVRFDSDVQAVIPSSVECGKHSCKLAYEPQMAE